MAYRVSGFKISQHAVARYQQRFSPVALDAALGEIGLLLDEAKPRYARKAKRKPPKRTTMVPAGECLFVFSRGVCATVIPLDRRSDAELHMARAAASDRTWSRRAPLSYALAIWAKASRLFRTLMNG